MENIKNEIIELAKKNGACSEGINDALNSNTELELFLTIKKHLHWLINSKTIDAEWLESKFSRELMIENGVLTSGKEYFENLKTAIITLGSSSATVETFDSSSATVETLGSSSATVKTFDSSSATVKTWGSSSATVETWVSSSATVETWGSSSATVETFDSSSVTVKTFDSSSKLSYSVESIYGATIKDLNKKKIFIKKSDWEVEVLN